MKLEKCILMSIKKEWCDLIKLGEKTIEWRKTIPKNIDLPCTCFIYETKANGGCRKIIGEFEINLVFKYLSKEYGDPTLKSNNLLLENNMFNGCVTQEKLEKYGNKKPLYAIQIYNLKIYDEPKPLESVWADENHPIELAQQSWRYCYREIE